MSQRQIKVIDAKTGQTLREDYIPAASNDKVIFGLLTVSDAFKIGSFLVAAVIFFVNGEIRQKAVEENQKNMTETLSRLVDFKENSDAWNSQVFGTRFRNGEPIDNHFKTKNNGNVTTGG